MANKTAEYLKPRPSVSAYYNRCEAMSTMCHEKFILLSYIVMATCLILCHECMYLKKLGSANCTAVFMHKLT